MNEGVDIAMVQQITSLFSALSHLQQDVRNSTSTALTQQEANSLYRLVNVAKEYDHILRIVDQVGTEANFIDISPIFHY